MNWEAVGASAELVAAIGVLISVAYLSIQVRANSEEVRENTLQSLLEKSVDLLGSPVNQHPDLLLARRKASMSELTEDQSVIFQNWLMRNFQFFELVYLQYKKGRIDDEVVESYRRRIASWIERSIVQQWWAQKPLFTESFVVYVDSIRNGRDLKGNSGGNTATRSLEK